MDAPPDRIELHHVEADQVVLSSGPLVMRIIEGARTEHADIDRVTGVFEQLLRVHARVGVLVVVHHGAPLPSLPVLRYMARSSALIRERGAAVFVMFGLGFWSMSAHRTVDALARFAGFEVPATVELEAAAERLAAAIPGLDAAAVLRAYEAGVRELTARPLSRA